MVKVIASAIKRRCLDPGVTCRRTKKLATMVRRKAMLPVDEMSFKTKIPELADRLGLVSFKLLQVARKISNKLQDSKKGKYK